MTELDDQQLRNALEDAFIDPEHSDDFVEIARAQQTAVRTLASEAFSEGGEDAAVSAVNELLETGFHPNDNSTRPVRKVAALAIVQADGGLTDYPAYLRRNDLEDTAFAFSRFEDRIQDDGPEQLRARLLALYDRFVDDPGE